jgi:phosphate-selective porin
MRRDPRWQLAAVALLALPAHAQQEPAPTAWQSGYDGGFFLRSQDRRNEVVLEGLFQADYVAFTQPVRTSEFFLKRMRPELAARFDDFLLFRLEPNFTEHEVELEEAWVGADLATETRLMIGRMKAPFGLEEVRSRRHIDFPRFSILNQFSPAEDHGLFVNGRACDRVLEYGAALYNGTGGPDTNDDKDFAARVMVHPFLHEQGVLHNLQLGVAATFGVQDDDVAGAEIRNESGGPVITFAPGARLDGERTRLGLELAWFHGPVMAQAEGLLVEQEMQQGIEARNVQFRGAYVNLGIVLTGEDKSFAGVDPKAPVRHGGSGAWVLATRFSELHCDEALADAGLVETGTFARRIRCASIGLNWVLNSHAIVRHAYVHSFYSDDVTIGGRQFDDEGALLIEWQLHF